jgi:Asp-tRNA(Asn)/Glu-tRNA(Gln) amidotransferase A subunit family amidase
MRLGYCLAPSSEFQQGYTREAVADFARRLAADGAWDVEEVDLRERLRNAHAVHQTIYHKSLAYYFTRELRHRDQISDVFLRITEEGKRTPLSVYREALDHQQHLTEVVAEVFDKFDALIMPSVAGEAPPIGNEEPPDPCLIWTLCGNPSISLPLFSGPAGLPYGLQVVAARYADYLLLRIAGVLFSGEVRCAEPTRLNQNHKRPVALCWSPDSQLLGDPKLATVPDNGSPEEC